MEHCQHSYHGLARWSQLLTGLFGPWWLGQPRSWLAWHTTAKSAHTNIQSSSIQSNEHTSKVYIVYHFGQQYVCPVHESSYSKVMGGYGWLDTLSIAPLSAVTQVVAHTLHCICTAGCAAQTQRQTQTQYLYIHTNKYKHLTLLNYQRSPKSSLTHCIVFALPVVQHKDKHKYNICIYTHTNTIT